MTEELTDLTISEALLGLESGDFSARELVEAHISAMERAKALNLFITETAEMALASSDMCDSRRRKSKAGVLDGIPIVVKDLFATENIVTTAGSKMLERYVPPYESTVTKKLWSSGAVMLGKANLDEFAMGSSNETSFFGPVENPWRSNEGDYQFVPGGSSGGSAGAVSARVAMGATGTDTGGSIRQPASFCGVVGLKPTYGRCSRWGIIAFASSLDQAGPITRTVRDAAIMLGVMAGYDSKDSTSVNLPVPDYTGALTGDIRGLRIGIPAEYGLEGASSEIDALWKQGMAWLREAGAITIPVELPHTHYALPAYYIVAPAEASSNLARYDGVRYGLRVEGDSVQDMYEKTRTEGFGAEVRRRIMIGTYVLSAGYYDAYYLKAQKVRTLIKQDFTNVFSSVDALITPTAPTAAFRFGERSNDPISMYQNDVFTVPASLAGLPGISVPVGLTSGGLPLGLQIIGKPFDEESVLKIADAIEALAEFSSRPQTWWLDKSDNGSPTV